MRNPRHRQDFERLLLYCYRRFAQAGRYVARESSATCLTSTESERLSLCLYGRSRYRVIRNGSEHFHSLRRGDSIYAAAGATLEPEPDSDCILLLVIFHKNLTCFLAVRHKPATDQSGLEQQILASFHSPNSMNGNGRHFCRILEQHGHRPQSDPFFSTLFLLVLLYAIELLRQEEAPPPGGKAIFTWEIAKHFIKDNIHRPISREDVASVLKVHPNHVSRIFSQNAHQTFAQYMLGLRMHRARDLLGRPELNVAQVATACGFSDPTYFSRCYRSAFGCLPSQARKAAN